MRFLVGFTCADNPWLGNTRSGCGSLARLCWFAAVTKLEFSGRVQTKNSTPAYSGESSGVETEADQSAANKKNSA